MLRPLTVRAIGNSVCRMWVGVMTHYSPRMWVGVIPYYSPNSCEQCLQDVGWCNDSLQSEDVGCVGSTQGCTGLIGVKALNSPSDWEQCLQDVGWCNTLLQSEQL